MSLGFLIQTLASLVAIMALAGLAAWAKIVRPAPELDDAAARQVLGEEFPDYPIGRVWVSADRRSAIARSGDHALIVYRIGDGYVARDIAWVGLASAKIERGKVALPLGDVAAPRARFTPGEGQGWPLMETAS